MATKTPTRAKKAPAAKKPTAPKKKPAVKAPADPVAADPVAELTAIDDGVSIQVGDAFADVNIKGRFDLDGLIAVVKRVDRARAELS